MPTVTTDEYRQILERLARASAKAHSVAPHAQPQCDTGNEPVAATEGTGNHPGRRRVRVVSYRTRACDQENLFSKYFVDALRYAGAIYEDSPQWAQIEVTQESVASKAEERTEIEIFQLT